MNPSRRDETDCECIVLQKTLATNWSYFKCIRCGKSYFSSGNTKVLDFSEEDKKKLNSKRGY